MSYKLSDVATYISVKINTDDIILDEYISTENMLPDKEGVTTATSLPSTPKTNSFQVGDVLFSNIRTYFRKVWFATFNGGVSNDVLVLRGLSPNILFDKYLYYILSNEAFIQYTVTTAKGTKMPRGDKGAIMNYEFELPPLETQQKIAHILSTLDDKIELNRKMNQTLEEMAQALFKSWFVDFAPVHAKVNAKSEAEMDAVATELGIAKEVLELFPSEFVESELGMIPLGWKIKDLKGFGRVITGKTPPKKVEDAYSNDGKPFITPTDIDESIFVTFTNRHLSESGQIAIKNTAISAGSICVTCIGSQMGKTVIAPVDSFTNQQINSIVVDSENLRNYLFCNLRNRKKEIFLMGSGGSTMPLLNKSSFEKIKVLLPSQQVLESFSIQIKDKLALVLENDLQSITLSKTRDTLLPKLLSGELDVSNILSNIKVDK